jgi:hypothetical protein
MAIEAKQIFEVLDFSELDPATIEKPEDFKEAFEKKYTSKTNPDKDLVSRLFGMEYGKFSTAMKKVFKKHGLDNAISPEDIKEKNFVELLDITESKLSEVYNSKIKELEGKSGQGNDEKVKEYEAELNKYKLRLQEAEGLKENVIKEYEGFKNKAANDFKSYKKQIQLGEIQKTALKFGSGVKDLEKKGFLTTFEEAYDFDYNDAGELLPIDKKTNTFIPNPKITGKYLTPSELYEQEAVKAGVWEKNPHQPGQAQPRIFNTLPPDQAQTPAGMPKRTVAPRA